MLSKFLCFVGVFIVLMLIVSMMPFGAFKKAQASAAYVQGLVKNSVSGTTSSAAFTNAITPGNTIILGIRLEASAVRTVNVSDTQGNLYTKNYDNRICGVQQLIFSATNIIGGADTVTVSLTGGTAEISFIGLEYSGLAKSSVFDQAASACAASATMNSGNTAPTSQTDELVVGFGIMQFNQTVSAYGPGFTGRVGSTGSRMWSEDKQVTAIGTYNATMTPSVSNGWNMMVATFKAENVVPDTTAPIISNVQATNIGQTSATITWNTDEPTDSQVQFIGTCPTSGCLTTLNTAMVLSHSVNVSTLSPNTQYTYNVKSSDSAGNLTTSNNFSFTTTAPDTIPPVISNVNATNIGPSTADITWTTDEIADSQVQFIGACPVSGCLTTLNSTFTTTHTVSISGLSANTTYTYNVKSRDQSTNLSTSSNASFTTSTPAASSYPVKLSANGQYLLDSNNQPVMINADTGWSLIAQLSKADADIYLSDRAQKGYNAILVNLLEHMFATNAPANIYGDQPFTTGGNFNTPNEAYFAHADWVINKAAEKGLAVILAPLYASGSGQGWYNEISASSNATIRAWGQYVGNRYKNFPNIIYVVGGDITPSGQLLTKLREFALGIKDMDTNHNLITAHNGRNTPGMDPWPNESWLTLSNVYSSTDTYTPSLAQYNRVPSKPFFLIEANYEGSPSIIRNQAYWTVLGGGLAGHIFGNCTMWHFNTYSICNTVTWQSQLNSQGSISAAYVGKLFHSRQFYTLVPDQNHTVLTAGYQSGLTIAATARAADGSSVIAYLPTSRTVTVDMTKISGTQAKAWWWNPSNNTSTLINTYSTTGTQNFTPPGSGDWVLVIDNAALNLPAPATAIYNPVPDTTAPVISNINVTNLIASNSTINWTTDEGADGQVVFQSPCPSAGCTTSIIPTLTTNHSVNISGLSANTTYSYQVKSKDGSSNLTTSPVNTFTTPALPAAIGGYPIKLSANKQYLLDHNNQPVMINGDTAWSLITQLTNADAELYLTDRAAKGYNLALVELIEHKFSSNAPANIYGDQPFTTAGNFATPNEAYFAHADWVIQKAAENGITVLLTPMYLGFNSTEGWKTEVGNSSLATMRSYGQFIGNRYKDYPNIIWVIGGDTDMTPYLSKMRELVAGIKDFDTSHLMTAHTVPEEGTVDRLASETWLDLNNIYTYFNSYQVAQTQYNKVPFRPFFLMETYYEREHSSTPLMLRKQAYWSVLSGGLLGHIYGNCPIWYFEAPAGSQYCSIVSWKGQLNTAPANQLAYVGKLFGSRPFYNLVPDQAHTVLTAGYGSANFLVTTARTSDGSTVISYIPASATVTIDMTKISGTTAQAYWYDPSNNTATLIGTFPTTGSRNFTTPNGNDWVLVIDNVALGFPPPGTIQSGPDTTPPTASISSPTDGATVSGITAITANASDNVGVLGVQFQLNGINIGTEDTASPFSINWDTTTVPNGTHALTAVARDAATNSTTSVQVFVTVSNLPPTINSFTANPNPITLGSATTLSWNVSAATSLSIDQGVGTVTGSSISVSPTTTTTYTLTAVNSTGSTTSPVTVIVNPPPPTINSFTASPSSIVSGGSSTLSWNVTGATSLSINQGIGDVTGNTSVQVTPAVTTTYVLTATNSNGSTTANTTVTIVVPPTINSFAANPTTITIGNSSTLSWNVTGATTLSIDQGIGTVTGTSISVSPNSTRTYTLTASNIAGTTQASTTITVNTSVPITYAQGIAKSVAVGTSSNAAFTNSVTTGNTIIVGVRMEVPSPRTVTVTDSRGNVYTKNYDLRSCGVQHLIFSATNITGGTDTVTVSISGTSAEISFIALEYAGLAKSNVFDQATSACATSAAMNSGNAATSTQANELVVGFGIMQFNQTVSAYGSGFTGRTGSTGSRIWSEDKQVSTIGNHNATMTPSASNGWNMMVATFKGL